MKPDPAAPVIVIWHQRIASLALLGSVFMSGLFIIWYNVNDKYHPAGKGISLLSPDMPKKV
jgi:hypothetical protein